MGPDSLFASLYTLFQAFAWLWVLLATALVVAVAVSVRRSRGSAWIRDPKDTMPVPGAPTRIADDPERAA